MERKKITVSSVIVFILTTSMMLCSIQLAVFADTSASGVNLYDFESTNSATYFPAPAGGTALTGANIIAERDTTVARSGSASMKFGLNYSVVGIDTSKVASFVSARTDLLVDHVNGYSFWVKSSDFNAIKIRITHQTGSIDIKFNHDISAGAYASTGGWHNLVLPDGWWALAANDIPDCSAKSSSPSSIGYPIKNIAFVVQTDYLPTANRNGVRTFWVDDMTGNVSPAFSARAVKFTREDTGAALTKLTTCMLQSSSRVQNYCYEAGAPVCYIMALYKDSELIRVNCSTDTITYNTEKNIETTLDLSDITDFTGYTVKVFIWNGLQRMSPIPSYSGSIINASGIY